MAGFPIPTFDTFTLRTISGPYTQIPVRMFIGEVPATINTVYTAPAAQVTDNPLALKPKAIIKEIRACNTSAAPHKLTLELIESGGSAGNARMIMHSASVGIGVDLHESCWIVMEASDIIQAYADATAVITLNLSGEEWL